MKHRYWHRKFGQCKSWKCKELNLLQKVPQFHTFLPCLQASWLFTSTLAAHLLAKDVRHFMHINGSNLVLLQKKKENKVPVTQLKFKLQTTLELQINTMFLSQGTHNTRSNILISEECTHGRHLLLIQFVHMVVTTWQMQDDQKSAPIGSPVMWTIVVTIYFHQMDNIYLLRQLLEHCIFHDGRPKALQWSFLFFSNSNY